MNDGLTNAADDTTMQFPGTEVPIEQHLRATDQVTAGFANRLVATVHKEFLNVAGAYDISERHAGLVCTPTKEAIGSLFIDRARCMPDNHDWKRPPEGGEPAMTGSIGKCARFTPPEVGETVRKLHKRP
jgi:hypothetical protein